MKRESGWYWVKGAISFDWVPAFYSRYGEWYLINRCGTLQDFGRVKTIGPRIEAPK